MMRPRLPAINGPGLATSVFVMTFFQSWCARAAWAQPLSALGLDTLQHSGSAPHQQDGARGPACPHASQRLMTKVALVPPKPKLFDMTQLRFALSWRLRTTGTSANSGSSSSILALSQMKSLLSISNE